MPETGPEPKKTEEEISSNNTYENATEPDHESESKKQVPADLAKQILPTLIYLYGREHQQFMRERNKNPLTVLLDPERIKTEREEQQIDHLAQQKIEAREATNREEAVKLLIQENLKSPRVGRYYRLIKGLETNNPVDIGFLTNILTNRRDHEEGMIQGDPQHWKNDQPPTKKEKKRFEAERDKMDRFLKQLDSLK